MTIEEDYEVITADCTWNEPQKRSKTIEELQVEWEIARNMVDDEFLCDLVKEFALEHMDKLLALVEVADKCPKGMNMGENNVDLMLLFEIGAKVKDLLNSTHS